MMKLTRRRGKGLAATTLIGSALVMTLATPASAGSTQMTDHESFDPTGAVFSCVKGDLTVQPGGTVDQYMHFGQDATGKFHYTGTITVHDITAIDANGNTYTIVGSSWFGGTAISEDQQLVATDTGHFVIHNAAGGVYDKVSTVDHFTLKGSTFSFNFGGCQEPQD